MAGVVRSVRSRLGHTLESAADRSLFIRVQPPPANLGERRAVLRAIQRYGDVDMVQEAGCRSCLAGEPRRPASLC